MNFSEGAGRGGNPGAAKHNVTADANSTATREAWLHIATNMFRPVFADIGFNLPSRIRVSCGFPSSGGSGRVRGEVWSPRFSADDTAEIFISPLEDDVVRVLGILAHELTHLAVGLRVGHRGNFKRVARALGLEGPARATSEGVMFKRMVEDWPLPRYPHAALMSCSEHKTQSTRLVKVTCGTCGCTARVARVWLKARPVCWQPNCAAVGQTMEVQP